MTSLNADRLWVEHYRPKSLEQCILPKRLKSELKQLISKGSIPHLMFAGSPGNGKTSTAKAICNDLGADFIYINGSEESGIDTLRGKIKSFASTVSLMSDASHKIVILDEADYLGHVTQPALRGLMEEFHKNCRFILTCNFKNRIIKPLHSRCTVVDFEIQPSEKKYIMAEYFKRAMSILDENIIEYNKSVLAEFVKLHFPDFRRILNELQRYSQAGVIDDGILRSVGDEAIKHIIEFTKNKRYSDMRKWVDENSSIDLPMLFDKVLDEMEPLLEPASMPELVLLLSEAQDKATRAVNPRILLAATIVEMMLTLKFK